jgi:hypothetical protein
VDLFNGLMLEHVSGPASISLPLLAVLSFPLLSFSLH